MSRRDALGGFGRGSSTVEGELGAARVVREVAWPMQQLGATEEVMSTQRLNRIVEHEVQVRRQGRIYLMGLVAAAAVVMASLLVAV